MVLPFPRARQNLFMLVFMKKSEGATIVLLFIFRSCKINCCKKIHSLVVTIIKIKNTFN